METFLLAYICIGVGIGIAVFGADDPPLLKYLGTAALIFGWPYFVIAAMRGE